MHGVGGHSGRGIRLTHMDQVNFRQQFAVQVQLDAVLITCSEGRHRHFCDRTLAVGLCVQAHRRLMLVGDFPDDRQTQSMSAGHSTLRTIVGRE